MNIEKKVENKDLYAGTHIVLTSDKIGTTEICRQQHKTPFHKTNMLKEHFLLFAVEGTNELQIGNQLLSLKKGEMLLMKKATYVEIVKRGEKEDDYMYESVSFSLKKDIILDFIKLVEMDDYSKHNTPNNEILIHPYGIRLQTFLASLKPYFDDTEKIKTGLYKLKILELLYDLSEENPVFLQQLMNLNRNDTRDLMNVVQINYLKPYTLEELAYISGRSLSGFRREFEALFQTTPAKWIQEKRLQKAKELISSTQLTVADVCYEVGYENVSHFSRLYKSHFGYNPSLTKSQSN
ncbi:AraC family transcriptional regulator [Pedobacter antarcticus 4BY]|uniref:AraC family transcriptional regulator n=2 Tax=Pedobacter antarcticus TaxID=34086 RepID=A0A081PF83_9SPHI|nr:AraC family transcriptional regulator [Pedobacter antarcticus]KEQ29356.1 AraC family transcriptional regulator [Pedobacter antarcticus 4BY]SFE78026.1 Helix-turn-helix domain-containing protein [Pedobacter antarcticus]